MSLLGAYMGVAGGPAWIDPEGTVYPVSHTAGDTHGQWALAYLRGRPVAGGRPVRGAGAAALVLLKLGWVQRAVDCQYRVWELVGAARDSIIEDTARLGCGDRVDIEELNLRRVRGQDALGGVILRSGGADESDLADVLTSCRIPLGKIGIDVTDTLDTLGCGYWGCAYKIDSGRHSGKVLKITEDTSEATMAEYLRAARAAASHWLVPRPYPKMLPQIEAAYGTKKCAHRRYADFYLILREDLIDIPNPVMDDAIELIIAVGILVRSDIPPHVLAHGLRRIDRLPGPVLHKGVSQSAQRVSRAWETNKYNAQMFVQWAQRYGATFGDMGERNWGVRNATGELVIRDVGVSRSPDPHAPRELSGIRRRRR